MQEETPMVYLEPKVLIGRTIRDARWALDGKEDMRSFLTIEFADGVTITVGIDRAWESCDDELEIILGEMDG